MSILHTTQTIDQIIAENERLESENAGLIDDLRGLRNRLAAAEEKRDTAQSLVSHYQRCYTKRTGW